MNQLDFAKKMGEIAAKREPFAVAMVVRTMGSSLGKPGFKIILSKEGRILYGTLGGVCPEGPIVNIALETMKTGSPRTIRVHLEDVESAVTGTISSRSEDEIHVETNCGGTMEIYVEPYLPPSRLILIGQGGKDDVEDSLVKLGKMLEFEVAVIDPLPSLSTNPDLVISQVGYELANFTFSESDYVIVLTKGSRDVSVLKVLSRANVAFVGLLASRKRVTQDIARLRKEGVRENFVKSMHAPVGFDIGAITPAEIALSIMADITAVKYGHHPPHRIMSDLGIGGSEEEKPTAATVGDPQSHSH